MAKKFVGGLKAEKVYVGVTMGIPVYRAVAPPWYSRDLEASIEWAVKTKFAIKFKRLFFREL